MMRPTDQNSQLSKRLKPGYSKAARYQTVRSIKAAELRKEAEQSLQGQAGVESTDENRDDNRNDKTVVKNEMSEITEPKGNTQTCISNILEIKDNLDRIVDRTEIEESGENGVDCQKATITSSKLTHQGEISHSKTSNDINAHMNKNNLNHKRGQKKKKENKTIYHKSQEQSNLRDCMPDCVIIDIETTGLNEIDDEIIEIGALKVRSGKVVETFQRMIAIENRLPEFIIKLTGITDEDLSDHGIGLPEALMALSEFVEDYPLVAHNISFDMAFLNQAYLLCNMPILKNRTTCTLELSRCLLPHVKSHKLKFLIDYFGITSHGEHRSLEDCESVFFLYQKLLSRRAK